VQDRNLDTEFSSNAERKYVYDFDSTIRLSLLDRVGSFLDPDGLTLEIGAFEGLMTSQILSRYPKLTVLEGSPLLANGIKVRFGETVSVVSSLLEDVNFDPKFRNIFLVHTLEHLDDPISALLRISSWLDADGILVIAVPNANALSRQIATKMGLMDNTTSVTEGERLQGHLRTYSMATLLSDISQTKLHVVESGGVIVKPLSNSQFDAALESELITNDYVRGCESLANTYPDLCATIFAVVTR
jgi:hypothetical protein